MTTASSGAGFLVAAAAASLLAVILAAAALVDIGGDGDPIVDVHVTIPAYPTQYPYPTTEPTAAATPRPTAAAQPTPYPSCPVAEGRICREALPTRPASTPVPIPTYPGPTAAKPGALYTGGETGGEDV